MKQYNIYENHAGLKNAVKQGWSWPGFCFSWIWCFVKKIYGEGISILVILFIFTSAGVQNEVMRTIALVVPLGIAITLGASGNKLREKNLSKRGWEKKKTITAENPEAAIAIYTQDEDEDKRNIKNSADNATKQELIQSGHPPSSHVQRQKTLTTEARKHRRIFWLRGLIGVTILLVILAIFIPKIWEWREFNSFVQFAQEKVEFSRPLLIEIATEIDPNTSPHASQKLYQTLRAMEKRPVIKVDLYMPFVGEDYMLWKYWPPFPQNPPGDFKETVVTKYVEKAALSAFSGNPSLIDAINMQTRYSWNEVLYDEQKRAVAVIRLVRWGLKDDSEERMIINLPS